MMAAATFTAYRELAPGVVVLAPHYRMITPLLLHTSSSDRQIFKPSKSKIIPMSRKNRQINAFLYPVSQHEPIIFTNGCLKSRRARIGAYQMIDVGRSVFFQLLCYMHTTISRFSNGLHPYPHQTDCNNDHECFLSLTPG